MKKILYSNDLSVLKKDYVRWFDVPTDIQDRREFILSIEYGLDFVVGGENWDSLDENLSDDGTFEHLKETGKRIMILNHAALPSIDQRDLAIYIKTLKRNVGLRFSSGESVDCEQSDLEKVLNSDGGILGLIVIFSPTCKEYIDGIEEN